MNYDDWINRERRIRSKFLMASPLVNGTRKYRLCQECGEICLCHEVRCPNCDADNILVRRVKDVQVELVERIRCRFRFEQLARKHGK